MTRIAVTFSRPHGRYNRGEVAGFDKPAADRLVAKGIADLYRKIDESAAQAAAEQAGRARFEAAVEARVQAELERRLAAPAPAPQPPAETPGGDTPETADTGKAAAARTGKAG
ncbi:hypothetical protein FDP22_06735 [Paroceanicella profunda]|uniref:Uncharacterized protein n=1 Tax=Paroceanicella profunda TaxID=2579971 RepID=A0A5B8FZ52_9RHOB|nr:hypothetical protein [Paroceanicella profunda]QDL91503.1 hypothetical protein FDP22_06735 [Paroceanicella profunda]